MTITRLAPLSPPWSVAVTNRGPAGVGATVEIDPVVTLLEPGEPGEVVNLGNETHVVLKFSLAGGDEGPVGPRPLLTIGTVTTVENGNAADVNLSGADGEYAVNFTIPAGPVGPPPTLEIGDVTSGPTADADVTGGAGSYVLDLVLPVGPAPTLLPGVVTAVPNGSPLTITFNETGPGEYTVDLEVPAGPTGPPGSMSPGDSVTLLNMATARILGRTAGGAGVVQELTKTDLLTFLNVADGANVTAAAAFANDNRLLRSDGTGKGAQASVVTLDDAGNLSGLNQVASGNFQGISLSLLDSNASHYATFALVSDITAARTFSLDMPNSAQTYKFPARNGTISLAERLQRAITGTTDTLVIADAGSLVKGNNASGITITIPPAVFPVGTQIDFLNINTGAVSFTPGAGVTLNSKGSKRRVTTQYGAATLVHESSDIWVLFGDIVT